MLEKWLAALRPYVLQTCIGLRYKFLKELGEGSYGKVCLAEKSEVVPASSKKPRVSNEEMKFNIAVEGLMAQEEPASAEA